MQIDTTFNFCSDSNGRDPDSASPTLLRYHKLLWTKALPSGGTFELDDSKKNAYLYYKSDKGEFYLGSDAISHSYKNQKKKKWITEQIPNEVDELFDKGCTMGAYVIFPNKRIDGNQTINQARGVKHLIDDRFDLTLECIRRFYLNQESPLYPTFLVYKDFFDLFCDFKGYVQFFLLQDLVDEDGSIKYYLPFDNFQTPPKFSDVNQYLLYKQGVTEFINLRNKRIENYVETR